MDGLHDDAPRTSVVLPAEPRKRRTGLLLGVGALVVAAVGVGALVITRNDDDGNDETYSLRRAVAAASELEQLAYRVESETMGEQFELDVALDVPSSRGTMTVSSDDVMDGVEMLVDLDGEVLYISGNPFEVFVEIDTDWLALDAEFLDATGTRSILDNASGNEVLHAIDLVDKAQSIDDLGLERIDGRQLRHYRVVVGTDDALAASPGAGDQTELVGGELPDQIAYDMWVDEGSRLVQVGTEIDAGPAIVSTLIVLGDEIGEPVDVDFPDPDDVTQASDLL